MIDNQTKSDKIIAEFRKDEKRKDPYNPRNMMKAGCSI